MSRKTKPRVLSIYCVDKGFAFALFDSPSVLRDWGTRRPRKDTGAARVIANIRDQLHTYQPDVLVVEGTEDHRGALSARAQRVHKAIARAAAEVGAETVAIGLTGVRSAFARFGVLTKQAIAEHIAAQFDAYATRAPRPRKRWMPEDKRMDIFDAASRGLAHYYQLEQRALNE